MQRRGAPLCGESTFTAGRELINQKPSISPAAVRLTSPRVTRKLYFIPSGPSSTAGARPRPAPYRHNVPLPTSPILFANTNDHGRSNAGAFKEPIHGRRKCTSGVFIADGLFCWGFSNIFLVSWTFLYINYSEL